MRIQGSQRSDRGAFWLETKRWVQTRQGLIQLLLAVSLGFLIAVSGVAWYRLQGWKIIEPPVRALFAEMHGTAETVIEANDLPTLYFDIGFEEYQTMAAQREEALQVGILLLDDDGWLPAQIRFQDRAIPVRIRLKGDWTDHLRENKWSFRVKTKGDAAIMGMRSFSVQSPHTRYYLKEWLFLEDLRRAGILAPRYSFVNVVVNGEDWGIYALEESFSKELLESQGRREGVIIRFDESLYWRRRALAGGHDDWRLAVDPIATTFEMPAFAEVDEFNTAQVRSDPILSEQSITALGLLRGFQNHQLSPSQVFDAELMGRYLAHSNLWGARHGLTWHNERYYYNPLTSRLEPIGYDCMPFAPETARFVDLAQYDDLAIMEAYAREVERISRPEYLETLRAEYADEYERYHAALAQEFPPEELEIPWDTLAERQTLLINALHPPQTVHAYRVGNGDGSSLDIQVGNLVRYAVVLKEIQVGDRAAAIQSDWIVEEEHDLLHQEAEPAVVLKRVQGNVPTYLTLHIPTTVIHRLSPTETLFYSNTLQIVTNLYGVEDEVVVDVRPDYPPMLSKPVLPPQPSVDEALERYPFLTLSDQPGFLELRPGTWHVAGDLVLPDGFGLWATQSVTLTFDRGALLFANGPLLLQGPDGERIYFGPHGDEWAGIIVLKADPEMPSRLHNVEIRGTAGIHREGWVTTGGVTFYESPVVLSHCRLLDSLAEDAINVVRSKFEFMYTEFGNTASDAFDGDFVQGRVEDCAFHDVGGDGIDVSGSHVIVQNVNLLRIHDKGISAGEGSRVRVMNARARDIGMALASKDMSFVLIQGLEVEHAWIAGLAAYLKKMEYGPAQIQADGVVFQDHSPQALVQTGSRVVINGETAETTDLNVDELYARLDDLAGMRILDYRLGPAIRLVGYKLVTPTLRAGDNLRLVLYWQADARPEQDYTVFVHVLDDSGLLAAQRDNMPGDDAYVTTQWAVGPLIDDVHTVPLPSDIPAGEYRVVIGMYLWQTGERLPVFSPDGTEIPNGAIILDQTFDVIR